MNAIMISMMAFPRRKQERRHSDRRASGTPTLRVLGFICALIVSVALSARAQLPPRPSLDITGYVINAELEPSTHHLSATATVTFTAPANLDVITFGFHPALKITKITDASGKVLDGEYRVCGGAARKLDVHL